MERRGPPGSGISPSHGNDFLIGDGPPSKLLDSLVITPEDDPPETDWTAGLDLQKGGGRVVKQSLTIFLSSHSASPYHGLDTLVGSSPSNSSSTAATLNRSEGENSSLHLPVLSDTPSTSLSQPLVDLSPADPQSRLTNNSTGNGNSDNPPLYPDSQNFPPANLTGPLDYNNSRGIIHSRNNTPPSPFFISRLDCELSYTTHTHTNMKLQPLCDKQIFRNNGTEKDLSPLSDNDPQTCSGVLDFDDSGILGKIPSRNSTTHPDVGCGIPRPLSGDSLSRNDGQSMAAASIPRPVPSFLPPEQDSGMIMDMLAAIQRLDGIGAVQDSCDTVDCIVDSVRELLGTGPISDPVLVKMMCDSVLLCVESKILRAHINSAICNKNATQCYVYPCVAHIPGRG